jgi:hypothetical protein
MSNFQFEKILLKLDTLSQQLSAQSTPYVLHETIDAGKNIECKSDICIMMYSHSEYSFFWKAAIPLLEKYAGNIKIYWCCDTLADYVLPDNWTFHKYDPSLSWASRIKGCLDLITTKYVIYLQEDWLLIDNIEMDKLKYLMNFMDEKGCKYLTSDIRQRYDVPPIPSVYTHYEFQNIHGHWFQPSIWNKELLYSIALTDCKMNENEVGESLKLTHASVCYAIRNNRFKEVATRSLFYPHIHAMNGGKWTFIKFPCLKALLESYGIDTSKRGVDNSWIIDYQ